MYAVLPIGTANMGWIALFYCDRLLISSHIIRYQTIFSDTRWFITHMNIGDKMSDKVHLGQDDQ